MQGSRAFGWNPQALKLRPLSVEGAGRYVGGHKTKACRGPLEGGSPMRSICGL